MSCLKLHWPQTLSLYRPAETNWEGDAEDGPVILAFPRIAGRIHPSAQRELLNRARTLHENRCCPECGRAAVVPVDTEPALAYRDQTPVPGSGALLGFACDSCGHEWQA